MRGKRAFSSLVAAACVLGAMGISTFAVEFDYTGPLDAQTGEPAQPIQMDVYSDQVMIADGVYFDRVRQGYVYQTPNGERVLCTIADGMVVQQAVQIVPDTGVEIKLYRDGELLEQPDLTHIYEVGDYIVEVDGNGQSFPLIAFSIVGQVTGRLTGYTMPSGFVITNVTLDDAPIGYERNYISMQEEGYYVVDYRCARNGLTYQLGVGIDHTPPVLALTELNERNQARGPVSIEDLEEGASIGITRDGQQIAYKSKLTESGDYQIIVIDEAGNVSRYEFSILIYFDWNSMVFLGIVLAVLASVGMYIFISKKRLQVR